jgi:hypothetical protein
VRGLTNDERLVVFMNVYHALLIHTLIEVGHAKVSRRKLYRMYAYDVGGHVLTLAEIEHGILRAPLSRPVLMRNSFLGKFLVPRFGSSDPRFLLALTRPYPRISLCLATGTMSSPGTVQVFRTATLEAQLTAGARSYVASKVGFEAKVCVLNICQIIIIIIFFFFLHTNSIPPPAVPRLQSRTFVVSSLVGRWYRRDFGGDGVAVVRALGQWMDGEPGRIAREGKGFRVRMSPYDWTRRTSLIRADPPDGGD